MEFPQQFPFLVIPTGAGPGQQRITINFGNDGEIKVYDSHGNLVDALGGPNGQFILYDSSGNMVISLASAAGVDEKTGKSYQAGITTYTSTTSINLFGENGTWTAADGSQAVLQAGNGAELLFTPANAGGPWFDGFVATEIAGGNHPAIDIVSPSDQTNGIASEIMLQGSSSTDATTRIFYTADEHLFGGVFSGGNIVVGGTVITPTAANTPTKGTVTFPSQLSGTTAHGFAVAQNSSANTFVSITNISTLSADIWISRPNTTATGVYYMVWYT